MDVSATSWSLVQRSPTDCGVSQMYVIVKRRTMTRPRPPKGCRAIGKKISTRFITIVFYVQSKLKNKYGNITEHFLFLLWLGSLIWAWASSFRRGFTITHIRHTTLGRTPLDEWPARRRDLYLTAHNTHKWQTNGTLYKRKIFRNTYAFFKVHYTQIKDVMPLGNLATVEASCNTDMLLLDLNDTSKTSRKWQDSRCSFRYKNKVGYGQNWDALTSGFRRDVDEICALLHYYAVSCGNCLPAFQDKVLVPSSRVKSPGPISCPEPSVNNYHTTPRNNPEERRSQNWVAVPHYAAE
jgi:hypothetical protein